MRLRQKRNNKLPQDEEEKENFNDNDGTDDTRSLGEHHQQHHQQQQAKPHRQNTGWFVAIMVGVSALGLFFRYQNVFAITIKKNRDIISQAQHAKIDTTTLETQQQEQQEASVEDLHGSPSNVNRVLDDAEEEEELDADKEVESTVVEGPLTTADVKTTAKATDETTKRPTKIEELFVPVATDDSSLQNRQVYFIGFPELDFKDAFSASWLQSRDDFMSMKFDRMNICEDVAFRAYTDRGLDKNEPRRKTRLRMTLDWLDFSVEHLSKWWKILEIYKQPQVYEVAMERFDTYLEKKAASLHMEIEQQQQSTAFQDVIGLIAFQQYKDRDQPQQAYNLTLKSLGVTIESLRRAGFGRVVVVGQGNNTKNDKQLVHDTFHHLQKLIEPKQTTDDNIPTSSTILIKKIGRMEVGFAPLNPEYAQTKHLKKNVPRASVVGLKEAFELVEKKMNGTTTTTTTTVITQQEQEYVTTWLGETKPNEWKYVYLTEPDSILQSRPNTLQQLKEQVDSGMVLVPHRLQPIPHESDVGGSQWTHTFLSQDDDNNNFSFVWDLDSFSSREGGGNDDACCDAHRGPQYKPGNNLTEGCGNFWYMCDFMKRIPKEERKHKRVRPYSLIRLKQGTGIVNLAALEHGRPCIPKKKSVCLLPSPPPNVEPT